MIVWPDCRRGFYPLRSAVARLVPLRLDSGDAVEHLFGSRTLRAVQAKPVFVPSPSGPPDETNELVPRLRLRPGARQQRPGHPWTPPTSPGNP